MKIKFHIPFFIFFFYTGIISAQSSIKKVSYEQLIESIDCERSLLSSIDELDKDKVYDLLKNSLEYKDTSMFFKFSLSVSQQFYYRLHNHEECIDFLKECEGLLKNKESPYASFDLHFGNHYLSIDKHIKAIYYFKKSIDWYKAYKPKETTVPLGNLATTYASFEQLDKAIKLNLEALSYSNLITDNEFKLYNLSFDYARLGKLYFRKGDHVKANEFHLKSLKASLKNSGIGARMNSINAALEFYNSIEDHKQVQALINLGDSITQSNHLHQIYQKDLFSIRKSHYYINTDQVEKAINPKYLNATSNSFEDEFLEYSLKYYIYTNDKENELLAFQKLIDKKNNDKTRFSNIIFSNVEQKKKIKELNFINKIILGNIKKLTNSLVVLIVSIIPLIIIMIFFRKKNTDLKKERMEILRINKFNIDKLSKYQNASKQHQQYFTILAHDIRSPIIKLQFLNEQLQSAKIKNAEHIVEQSKVLNNEIEIMIDQFEAYLSNTKKGANKNETINLETLFNKCAELTDPKIYKPFKLRIVGPKVVQSNLNCIKTILKNCIENSMKYSSNEVIQFTLNTLDANKKNIISLTEDIETDINLNSTIPIKKDEIESKNIESFGLGLSLCDVYAKNLGGWLKVNNKNIDGFKVTFCLGPQTKN